MGSEEPAVAEAEDYEGPEGLLEKGSDKLWPNRQEDEQDMEMEPVVIAPPGYGSPDPATQEGILVPVEESPLDIAEDYGSESVPAAEGEEGAEAEAGNSKPSASATRAEWDEYARSQGVDPDQYSSKDDLMAALA